MKYGFQSKRIKEWRESQGMSLEQMGKKLCKPKQLLSVWENGVNTPSLDSLMLICNTFSIEPSFFLSHACDTVDGEAAK